MPGHTRLAAEVASGVGRRAVRARLVDPAFQVHALPAQVGRPERLGAAAVEPHGTEQAALAGACVELAQGQHAVGQHEVGAQRFQRFEKAAAEVEVVDVDQNVGIHRTQCRQIELAVRQHATGGGGRGRGGALRGRAGCDRRGPGRLFRGRAHRRAEVGEHQFRGRQAPCQHRPARPRIVGEGAGQSARADCGVLDDGVPDNALLGDHSLSPKRAGGRQGDVKRVAHRRERRALHGEAPCQRGQVQRVGRGALEGHAGAADARIEGDRQRERRGLVGDHRQHAGGLQLDANRLLAVAAAGVELQARCRTRRAVRRAGGSSARCRRLRSGNPGAIDQRILRVEVDGHQRIAKDHRSGIDLQAIEHRHARRLGLVRRLGPGAELPRGTAIGQPLDLPIELRRAQFANAQRRTAARLPQVGVAQLQAHVAGEQHVRRLAPRRCADLDTRRPELHASKQVDRRLRAC